MSGVDRPPRLPLAILRLAAPKDARGRSMEGDLREEWHVRVTRGRWRAGLWLWIAALTLTGELVIEGLWSRLRPLVSGPTGRQVGSQALQDCRLAVRNLSRRPLFTLLATLSLAIGIGGNTAIFSVVNRMFLRPLGGMDSPERVVELGSTRNGEGFDTFAYPEIVELQERRSTFAQVAAWTMGEVSRASDESGGEPLLAFWVSANYFAVLGAAPAQGRFFVSAEDRGVGAHPVAVVSHAFWRRALGSDPDVVGKTLRLNRQPHRIVGVASETFRTHVLGLNPEVWIPLTQSPEMDGRESYTSTWAFGLARLAPGTSRARADATVREVFRGIAEIYPESHANRSARVLPLGPIPGAGRAPVRTFSLALMGLVGLVLLVTCANVAGMMLARSATRGKEIAIRAALGASRFSLVRYLGVEALILFVVGGTVGVASAYWGLGRIDLSSLPLPVRLNVDLSPDGAVLRMALAVTLLTGVVFGTLPSLGVTRPDLVHVLKGAGITAGGRSLRLRRAFVSGQIALSLLLLAAAALFLRSLQEVDSIASGFDPEGVYMTGFDLSREGYENPDQQWAFLERLADRVRAIPGAEGVAFSVDLPLDLASSGTAAVVDGLDPDDRGNRIAVDVNRVTEEYFRILGIPVLTGRSFTRADRPGAQAVAIVSRTFADRAWPGQDPIGRSVVLLSGRRDARTVVGVVEDVKNATITDAPKPFVYTPLAQRPTSAVILTAALPGDPASARPQLLEAVRRVDASIATTRVVSVAEYTGVGTLPQRLAASATSGFGLIALLLTGLGIYGIIALSVAQRTREIGIRKALGARARDLRLRVLGWAVWLSLPGLLLGLLLIAVATPLLRSLLVRVGPGDPVALAAVALAFSAVIVVATLVPARRASAVDPMEALRCE